VSDLLKLDQDCIALFNNLKDKIRGAQFRTAIAVNQEVIKLYWHIGNQIVEKQRNTQWGSKLIEVLSRDLQSAFPETRGFSTRNLERMRQFSKFYSILDFAAQAVPQLPWGHIVLLNQRVKEYDQRKWYAHQTIENEWAREVLDSNIKRDLYEQQAIPETKTSNFIAKLLSPQSLLAQSFLKNPYNFDFLGLPE
jgi:predicted nuclease of restriction endonuclease-like (RecB) superfamily